MHSKTISEKAQTMTRWYYGMASVQEFVERLGSSCKDLKTDEDWAAIYDLFIEDRDSRKA